MILKIKYINTCSKFKKENLFSSIINI